MSDEKKIEFSQSDVLNALLHQRGNEQHYATQESVDNVKERLTRFERQTDKQFEAVHEQISELKADTNKRFDAVNESINELKANTDKRFDKMEAKLDKLLFLIIGLFIAGFSALYFK
ncbi:hypothetical protein [Vibrio jasicida]|uniref:hypothetical protein n=1 Tax=Vibrio jasicida TaxID=766224 RepID=UPI0005EFB396|nr:hypothetical protein [Vibrio jasicida]